MSDQIVQIAPDSTGKKVQTFENSINSQMVQAQAIVPVDDTGVFMSIRNVLVKDVLAALKNILNALLRPIWVNQGTARVKCDVEAAVISSGTVTTVSTVTTMTQMSGFTIKDTLLHHTDRNVYYNGVRTRIS